MHHESGLALYGGVALQLIEHLVVVLGVINLLSHGAVDASVY